MSDDADRIADLRDWFADDNPTVVHSAHLGMAVKLAKQFGGQLLFVEKVGWHRWDGTRWAPGAASHARRAVHTVIKRDRAEVEESTTLNAKEKAKALARIERFETASAISGILTEAAVLHQFWIDVKALDADPWLLNCANGTLDLHTLELHGHDPTDHITKVTVAAHDDDATGTVWQAFLEKKCCPTPTFVRTSSGFSGCHCWVKSTGTSRLRQS